MSTAIWAGILLILAPLAFNITFTILAMRFDYPDILRRPTNEILERFHAGGPSLILVWWGFMMSGLIMIVAVVILSQAIGFGGIVPVATTVGVLAGLVQMLGLLRWVYLVPALARKHLDLESSAGEREANAAVFGAFHHYLGVGVGEHLGYLLTGMWSVLIGVALVQTDVMPSWIGWPGLVIGTGLVISSTEFLGPNEERGWSLAGKAVPVLYVAWSVWLLALGVALLVVA